MKNPQEYQDYSSTSTSMHSGPVDPKKWPKVEFKIYFKQYFICHKNISENI